MDQDSINLRLANISTLWSVVQRANDDTPHGGRVAREQVLERYGGAVRRYLLGALHDSDAADDVFQDFAVQFLCGRLSGADPERGRFRDYLRGILFRLVAEHHRSRRRRPALTTAEALESVAASIDSDDCDEEFCRSWRDELLLQSWKNLQQIEQDSDTPYYTLLRMRTEQPGVPSHVLAEQLSSHCGRVFQPAAVRQILRRARQRFTDRLLRHVVDSLQQPTAGELEQELIDVGLLDQCRPAQERWISGRTDSK